jgi:hypothetical protein
MYHHDNNGGGMKLLVKNTTTGLIPLFPSDLDEKRKLKIGREYEVEIKHPRNIGHHRKFFALLNLAHDNTSLEMPFDTYRKYLVMKAGYFDVFKTPRGDFYDAKSISFASMPQDEFEELYSRVLDVIIQDLGCTEEEVTENLINFF